MPEVPGASEYGREHCRRARTERAVQKAFSAPVLSQGSVEPHSLRNSSSFVERQSEVQPLGDARGQLPFLAELLVDEESFPG